MEKKKMKRWKKVVLSLVCVVIALVVIAGIAVGVTWGNEISTAASIEKLRDRDDSHLDGSVYRMDVKGGFYFDKYLEEGGASTDAELISFITDNITKGLIDMGIKESNIGCASFTAQTEDGDQLSPATMILPRPIPAWCLPIPATDGMRPSPQWICSFWELTPMRTWKV